MTRALAVIDGEHYPPVVRDALRALPHEVVAVVLAGGTEKLRAGEGYGVPVAASLEEGIAEHRPDVVLDLSDEPVLGPVERFALASRALAAGVAYEGADFRFDPPVFAPVSAPALAVVGTGKRIGKTAVTGALARSLSERHRVVVVAMGRGGPPEPEVIRAAPTLEGLLELSRAGRHAASDHLETALLAGVETVGCRRCGGGLAGRVAVSNVLEGARVAEALGPDLVVFDGSGAALPPVEARRITVVPAHQDVAVATGYLNAFRLRIADLVVLTMAEEGSGWERLRAAVLPLLREGVAVVPTVLRPRPSGPVAGKEVAWFGTAPPSAHTRIAAHLRDAHGARVVHVSGSLADREALRAELQGLDAEVFVVELKAAAVDVVAEEAVRRGVEVVVAANDVASLPGEPAFAPAVRDLADSVLAAPVPA